MFAAGLLPTEGSFRKEGLWQKDSLELVDKVIGDGSVNTHLWDMASKRRKVFFQDKT